jgi:hypothetical protein
MNTELNNFSLCQFIEIDYNLYLCENCGVRVTSYDDNYPVLICATRSLPNIEDIQSYIDTIKKPDGDRNKEELCTEDQIMDRLNVCNSCEFFNKKQSVCDKCGCFLSKQRLFMNKLALSKASCPIEKW